MKKIKKIEILDIPIDAISLEEIDEMLAKLMSVKKKSLIATVNTEFIVNSTKDHEFKEILTKASLRLADGVGILWAAKFLSNIHKRNIIGLIASWFLSLLAIPFTKKWFPIPQRITGADFIWYLSKFAVKNNYKLFLLGGEPTVAERTALELQTQIYGLKVAGVHSGDPKDTPEIIKAINKSKADILMVAFGSPKQEKWLSENLSKTSCIIGIGVGGGFDFIAGVRKRAPKCIQNIGLEWLYRLLQEPRRIKRQMSLPIFALKILKAELSKDTTGLTK